MRIKFFNWYGGKIRVVDPILALLPSGITAWYEVCAGSAAVTLNKVITNGIEIVNDLDHEIVNLFNVMTDRQDGLNLVDRLTHLMYSEREFILAKRAQENRFRGFDALKMAECSYILITQSFNSCRKVFRRGVDQHDYYANNLLQLPEVHKRLQGVRVMQHNATYILEKMHNAPNAFIFADLPYLHSLRAAGACNV